MNNKLSLIAFLAVLLAIVVLVGMACVMAAMDKSIEAAGIGAAVTGLIGVIGTFRPRAPNPTDPEGKDMLP